MMVLMFKRSNCIDRKNDACSFEVQSSQDKDKAKTKDKDEKAKHGKAAIPIVTGHFRDGLHGLCAHPVRQECATVGDDKTLRVWRTDSFGAAIATLKGQSGGLAWAWLGTRFALPVTAARYRVVRTGASAALRLCGGVGADWIIVRCVGLCQPRL